MASVRERADAASQVGWNGGLSRFFAADVRAWCSVSVPAKGSSSESCGLRLGLDVCDPARIRHLLTPAEGHGWLRKVCDGKSRPASSSITSRSADGCRTIAH